MEIPKEEQKQGEEILKKINENKEKKPKKINIIKRIKNRIKLGKLKKIQKKDYKKRNEIFNELKKLKELIYYIDKKILKSRKDRKVFWRRFISEGTFRESVVLELMKQYIPSIPIKKKGKK